MKRAVVQQLFLALLLVAGVVAFYFITKQIGQGYVPPWSNPPKLRPECNKIIPAGDCEGPVGSHAQ